MTAVMTAIIALFGTYQLSRNEATALFFFSFNQILFNYILTELMNINRDKRTGSLLLSCSGDLLKLKSRIDNVKLHNNNRTD